MTNFKNNTLETIEFSRICFTHKLKRDDRDIEKITENIQHLTDSNIEKLVSRKRV